MRACHCYMFHSNIARFSPQLQFARFSNMTFLNRQLNDKLQCNFPLLCETKLIGKPTQPQRRCANLCEHLSSWKFPKLLRVQSSFYLSALTSSRLPHPREREREREKRGEREREREREEAREREKERERRGERERERVVSVRVRVSLSDSDVR